MNWKFWKSSGCSKHHFDFDEGVGQNEYRMKDRYQAFYNEDGKLIATRKMYEFGSFDIPQDYDFTKSFLKVEQKFEVTCQHSGCTKSCESWNDIGFIEDEAMKDIPEEAEAESNE